MESLLDEGAHVLRRMERFVDHLQNATDGATDLGKRRRLIWMTSKHKLNAWRTELRGITSNICRLLIAQNM